MVKTAQKPSKGKSESQQLCRQIHFKSWISKVLNATSISLQCLGSKAGGADRFMYKTEFSTIFFVFLAKWVETFFWIWENTKTELVSYLINFQIEFLSNLQIFCPTWKDESDAGARRQEVSFSRLTIPDISKALIFPWLISQAGPIYFWPDFFHTQSDT